MADEDCDIDQLRTMLSKQYGLIQNYCNQGIALKNLLMQGRGEDRDSSVDDLIGNKEAALCLVQDSMQKQDNLLEVLRSKKEDLNCMRIANQLSLHCDRCERVLDSLVLIVDPLSEMGIPQRGGDNEEKSTKMLLMVLRASIEEVVKELP